MGKVKQLKLLWQLYVTCHPVWDLENFRPLDFCSTECTCNTELPSCNHCCRGKAVGVLFLVFDKI